VRGALSRYIDAQVETQNARGAQLLACLRVRATCMELRDQQPDAAQTFLSQQLVLPVADGHHPGAAAAVPAGAASARCFTWVTATGFVVLTLNSGMAVHRSHGDRETIAFVALAYLDLVALLFCLRGYENAEPGSQLRDRLKIVVWLLTTALTLLFSLKVAALVPPAVAVVVWLLAFGTVAGGFYALFCCSDKQ
jgi:hypothetical protein